ncbi:gag-pol fusion protein, partial [Lasius niger]
MLTRCRVTATLDKLRGARYLSTLDLKNGYWQVPLTPDSRPITAFTIPGRGLFQFRVMPFGRYNRHKQHLRRTPAITSRGFPSTTRRPTALKPREIPILCRPIKIPRHVVDHQGIRTDPEKVSAVVNWPEPRSVKQVRQFLGMASWYLRFIANFSTLAAPLTRLTKKNARWTWGAEEDTAFHNLKKTLTTAPVLACPDFTRQFVLQTDASTSGLGAVLTQHFEAGERVIAYASRTLNGA